MTASAQIAAAAPYGSVGRRIAAYLIDGLLSTAIYLGVAVGGVLVLQSAEGIVLGAAASLAFGIVQWVLLGTKGNTVGQRMLGVCVVDADAGTPIGMGRAFVRYLVLSLCGIFFIPLLVLLVFLVQDSRRQGWHDKAARSVVVTAGREGELGVVTEAGYVSRTPAPPPPAQSLATSAPLSPPPAPAEPAPRASSPGLAIPPPATPAVAATQPVPAAPLPSGGLVGSPPGLIGPPPADPIPTAVPATAPEPVPEPVPEVESAPAARSDAVERGWVLRPSSGSAYPLSGGAIVAGRDPDAGLVDGAVTWPVDDPALTVSKTHASFTVVGSSVWVEDLDSTHGVLLRRNGDEAKLDPRRSTRLLDGDVVVLGTFEISIEGAA